MGIKQSYGRFIIQVQSAILPFVYTLEAGQHLHYLK